ncbi:MAG: tRNA (N6-isopentenyl adenosine(37)-C2)-methylthiotransferase MiaB [bacterium]|nr:tRNA (N6-isopentenyl adenosine(37)-C2)-methylthiotransferase MiaB [bacterium]
MNKTYSIITYGCAMNRSDSERIVTVLEKAGYRKVCRSRTPDILVFNACSVRQSAIDRIYGQMEKFSELKRRNPHFKVIATGCILPRDRQRFFKELDLIFNIKDLTNLPRFLKKLNKDERILPPLPILAGSKGLSLKEISYFKTKPGRQSKFSALVPISFGCNRFCAYCAVPYTRGLEINRPGADILAEVANLVSHGYKEIWLLGQTVSSWRDPQNKQYKFVDLLRDIEQIPGKFWVRFESSYILDFGNELIDFLAKAKKVNNYLNLPLQSGSDRILKKMNRKYAVKQYSEILKKMKAKIPDFSFSTDIIIGFCGEMEKDFQDTYNVFKKIQPTMAYIAQYSSRPGTVAERLMKDNVLKKLKEARFEKLTRLLRKTAKENLGKEIGKTLEVLVDTYLPKRKECLGRSRNFKTVRFKSQKNLCGKFANVKILKAREFELEGRPEKS